MQSRVILITLLLFTNIILSQSKEELEAKEFIWGANDKYSEATEIPEKWSNESAVVIYKNVNYDFHKFGKKVEYRNSLRKRIKLLDKAAVDEFSEFSFVKRFRSEKGYYVRKKGENFVGIKIIKPDGSEIEIDVDAEAVEVDGETKLAISNLEVGDIIDFYFYKIEPFKSKYAYGFAPVEEVLGEEYPVMDYKLFFETENDFFINFKSFNDAPELKEIEVDERNTRRYELTAKDLPKTDFPRWFYPLVELPSYKFQVYFARSGKFENRAMAFLPEKEDVIKSQVSSEEVLDLYDTRLEPSGNSGLAERYLKDNDYNDKSDAEKAIAAYYYTRHIYLTRYVEAFYTRDAEILDYPFAYYTTGGFISSQKEFVKWYANLMKELDIDYEIIVAKKRYDGPISDLLIEDNIETIIKVNTDPPQYFDFFTFHTSDNYISPHLEGTDAYSLTASRNKLDELKKIKLPLNVYTKNESKTETTLTINPEFDGVNIESIASFKGHEKTDEQKDRMFYIDYVNEDYERYDTESLYDLIKRKKTQIQFKKEFDALTEKIRNNLLERYEKVAASNLEIEKVENYNYDILETGRYGLDQAFKYSESYDAKNVLIKKAGANYILEVGKLIGGQIDLTDKERTRSENIYQAYGRILYNTVKVNIPDGYEISGLDKLSFDVDNDTGSFKSEAKIEGSQLIINTTKAYKNNFEPAENWPKMIEFLDAAKQFTNEKILLKAI